MQVYDLEQPSSKEMPFHPNHKRVGYTYVLHRKHRDTELKSLVRTGASGMLVTTEHAGTHIDALCHQALDHKLHGGIEITGKIETAYGFTSLGIETCSPIVSRGILLDIAGFRGTDALPRYDKITLEELKECCKDSNVAPRRGDVVLVRTGYGKYWNDERRYLEAAGVSLEGAEWLASTGVKAVGADNMSFETDDGKIDPKMQIELPCHALLLVEHGIHIIENMNLEEIASAKVHEFLFVCSPLKLVGATGSPVRPLAISGVTIPE
jgi:kynurenine formamidase